MITYRYLYTYYAIYNVLFYPTVRVSRSEHLYSRAVRDPEDSGFEIEIGAGYTGSE